MLRTLAKFVPFRRIELRSGLAPAEVSAALARTTSNEDPWFSIGGGGTFFRGTVDYDSFEVMRRADDRNGFVAVLTGTIEATPRGSSIHLSLRPRIFPLVFAMIWMGFNVCGALGSILTGTLFEGSATGLLALVFAVCGAIFFPRGFNDEADFAIARLRVTIGATVEI